MFPDFTSLDPDVIAKFWTYLIGYSVACLVTGLAMGFSVCLFFYRKNRESLKEEKELFEENKRKFESCVEENKRLKEELNELNKKFENNISMSIFAQEKNSSGVLSEADIHNKKP